LAFFLKDFNEPAHFQRCLIFVFQIEKISILEFEWARGLACSPKPRDEPGRLAGNMTARFVYMATISRQDNINRREFLPSNHSWKYRLLCTQHVLQPKDVDRSPAAE
jgi:hypothetical protein